MFKWNFAKERFNPLPPQANEHFVAGIFCKKLVNSLTAILTLGMGILTITGQKYSDMVF